MNEKRKYLLKAHIPILHKGNWYTQPTLTDEVAEEYLKLHPDDRFKFVKIPKEEKSFENKKTNSQTIMITTVHVSCIFCRIYIVRCSLLFLNS